MKYTTLLLLCVLITYLSSSTASSYLNGEASAGLLRVFSDDFISARLDPVSGQLSCKAPYNMPNTTCKWVLGKGTRGQNTAMFYLNQTFFFVAQEDCDGTIGRTALILLMGPFCYADVIHSDYQDDTASAPPPSPPYIRTYPIAYLRNGVDDVLSINLDWDHTCNVVVQAPMQDPQTFTVNQVSEYDGQQRFQPTYTVQDGWRKVNGVGALDFGNFHSSWPANQELNCGNECQFYTLEEQVPQQLPRYLVGRAYRTGTVISNITDSVQLHSLSWNPWLLFMSTVNQFLGIGKCCSEAWCHADCAKFGDNLVLISFSPATTGIQILAEIGELDEDTIRLGVEFSPAPFAKDYYTYVFHQNTVLTYALQVTNGVVSSASLVHTSPPVQGFNVHMWANPGYN